MVVMETSDGDNTDVSCDNCRRAGRDIHLTEYRRSRLRGKNKRCYFAVDTNNGCSSMHLCGCCDRYLLEGSNDATDYWPAMIYCFLSHKSLPDTVDLSFVTKWSYIPLSWRRWWLPAFQNDIQDHVVEPMFDDVSADLSEAEEAIRGLKWKKLALYMDRHLAYPEVQCPFGCSEFLARTNKLPLKDFLWYVTNYQMKCHNPPTGKHWTDHISPSYPSTALILERFSCRPSIAITDDGPMILSCREHSTRSTEAYLHVPESPTGNMYSPNSNSYAPVVIRSKVNKNFKVGLVAPTYSPFDQPCKGNRFFFLPILSFFRETTTVIHF